MGFVGVYRAIYDYTPSEDNELPLREGDLLCILEKSSDDNWWKAKKKAHGDEDQEPEGLVPNNYLKEVAPLSQARALYDYSRQTDEELSFSEEAILKVYDVSEDDWILAGLNDEYGFVPANYIEVLDAQATSHPVIAEQTSRVTSTPSPPESPVRSPATALAGILAQKTGARSPETARFVQPPRQYTPDASDEEQAPSLPRRPPSQQVSPVATQNTTRGSPEPPGVMASPPFNRAQQQSWGDETPMSPGTFHMYNIFEMVSHLGKNKKMPTTLGVNLAKGVIMIAPAKSKDGPSKEWTAEKMTHYSIEGKHVFIELIRPSRSIDFHAGTKDTAQEIVSALGELAGASRAEGLREIIAAGTGTGQKTAHMLYEFMAQGEDEVTVAVGDDVLVLDDTKSEEWWKVRRLKNGKEGVVPSSYVEITSSVTTAPPLTGVRFRGESIAEQNRREEERLAREAVRNGAGVDLPDRNSSLQKISDNKQSPQSDKRDSRGSGRRTSPRSEPNMSKLRTWTDRSGTFKVEAEFLGLKDSKIHLHKANGVKIAVPITKMSSRDIEYVEQATGQSLEEEKPLSDIKRKSTHTREEPESQNPAPSVTRQQTGAAVERTTEPKYDWFEFFLACGVNPQICQRYASAFERDQMREENMQDIDAPLLRTLGLKEGDILRVMRFLDSKFNRIREQPIPEGTDGINGDGGGLFSGPGGALKNNTRKGRPARAVQTNDIVSPGAFDASVLKAPQPAPKPVRAVTAPQPTAVIGFEDDAWDVKPTKEEPPSLKTPSQPGGLGTVTVPQRSELSGALAELSLLSPPLQPTSPPPRLVIPQIPAMQPSLSSQPLQPQRTGADPSFFNQLAAQATGVQNVQAQSQTPQLSIPRQRPQAPTQPQAYGQSTSLQPPLGPPARPSTAPLQYSQQPSAFSPPPLQPQMTGYQTQIAPPGQSLNDIAQQRMQQSFNQQQSQTHFQPTGLGYGQQSIGAVAQQTGFSQYPLQPQPTGYIPFPLPYQTSLQPSAVNGHLNGSPFADPPIQQFIPQPTGFQQRSFSSQPPLPQQTGINSLLMPALQPQPTGLQNGSAGWSNRGLLSQTQQQSPLPPLPPMPQQPTVAPLMPQKTGPAPPIRFGVTGAAQKLVPQATGRANLAKATPQNPFGF